MSAVEAMTSFSIADLSTTDRYKLMTGLIVPRPIGWVGTSDAEGVANLAPYSFFQAVARVPRPVKTYLYYWLIIPRA